jgi:hypothetical protein
LGPLPSSTTLAVRAGGFWDRLACVVRRFAAAVDARLGFGAGRCRGASTFTGGRTMGFPCALAVTGRAASMVATKTPAQ